MPPGSSTANVTSTRDTQDNRRTSVGTKMATGGSAVFGGADNGRRRFGGIRWSRRWRRDDGWSSVEPTMAAGQSAGFGGADDSRGTIGGLRWSRRWPREVRIPPRGRRSPTAVTAVGTNEPVRREAPRRGDDGARTHQRCLGNHRKERPSPPPSIPSTHVQSLVEGEASCRDGVFEGVP